MRKNNNVEHIYTISQQGVDIERVMMEVQKKVYSGAFPGCKTKLVHDSLICDINPECEKQFDDFINNLLRK